MAVKLTKYIPSKMRLDIAQEVIEKKGIRPLARELDVNPKSVYKYKQGTAHPGDEVMAKILTIANSEEEISLQDYLDNLREEFLNALEVDIRSADNPEKESEQESPVEKSKKEGGESSTSEETEDVVQRSTEAEDESSSVDEKSTEKLELSEIFEKINVTKPFNQSKVEKILNALKEEPSSTVEEIIEISNISEGAVEKYLERLTTKNIVGESADGTYELLVKFEGEG